MFLSSAFDLRAAATPDIYDSVNTTAGVTPLEVMHLQLWLSCFLHVTAKIQQGDSKSPAKQHISSLERLL